MIGIVIVAHGGLAKEYLQTVEHIVGKQPGVKAIEFEPEYERDIKEQEICAAADAVDQGEGVVVVTDLFGASPANLSLFACKPENRRIIYGANLPLLIKLAKCRDMALADAVRAALAAGKRHVGSLNMTSDD
ncbi:MAG: PTS sugar transporter subunit IIA [Paracoccaceae bacterium]